MFGLDDYLVSLSSGSSILIVVLVATLLGLRHATDPDHIAAITTLVASGQEQARRRAAALGAWWGLGHAVTLVSPHEQRAWSAVEAAIGIRAR